MDNFRDSESFNIVDNFLDFEIFKHFKHFGLTQLCKYL